MLALTVLSILLATTQVSAVGCATHTFGTCEDNIVHWYDPDDGQICDPLDCGGGRAPAKTDVPCCANYKGTEACVQTPSYLPCFKDKFAPSTSAESAAEATPTADATTTAETTGFSQATEAATSEEDAPAPTTAASQSESESAIVSTTAPPASSATTSAGPTGNGTVVGPSGNGNATLSGTQGPTATPAGNAASGVRYDALVAIAGALVALI
ncbi:hypothetical protein N0V90_004914 [Kalmusia sp. IMI 367209]|nr:hypothetical protein N0V90_004914 [Kalmusia sp. IMI 367209]